VDENLLNDEEEKEEVEEQDVPRYERRPFNPKPFFSLGIIPSPAGRVHDVYTLGFNREFALGLSHLLSQFAAQNLMSHAHYGFLMQLKNCINDRTPQEPIRCEKCGRNYPACKPRCPACFPRYQQNG
jgi:hypothetical protein